MPNWDYPSPFVIDLLVTSEHIDKLGHVNNTVYINWCQDVAWAHSGKLGLDVNDYGRLDRAMVVRKAHYEYLAAAFANDAIEVGTWLTETDGRLLMTRHFQIRRASDALTLVRGDWELACIRISTGKPSRMPGEFLRCYLGAVVSAVKTSAAAEKTTAFPP